LLFILYFKGKSVAIGMVTASAILMGFSNIYITAPNPENLITYFEFLLKSLEILGMKENHLMLFNQPILNLIKLLSESISLRHIGNLSNLYFLRIVRKYKQIFYLLPDILCVIQLCLEGEIPKNIIGKNSNQSQKPAGVKLYILYRLGFNSLDIKQILFRWPIPIIIGCKNCKNSNTSKCIKNGKRRNEFSLNFICQGYGSKAMELLESFFKVKWSIYYQKIIKWFIGI